MTISKHTYRFLGSLLCLLGLLSGSAFAQTQQADSSYFEINGREDRRVTIPFELINNLVVIEAQINGSTPLKFIVDTGVRYTLITSLYNREVYLNSTRIINLAGLGEGEVLQAYFSEGNILDIDRVSGRNMEVVILQEDIFKLASFMGTEVHGLIGYDLFKNFVVEINYKRKHIYLYKPEEFEEKFEKLPRHRKWHEVSLFLDERKSYVNVDYHSPVTDSTVPLRLLVDTGSSNAFSLYELAHPAIKVPENTIDTFLGTGLSGDVTGELGRIPSIQLDEFTFEEPVVAYPDSISIRRAFKIGKRQGSIGGEAFRRFKVIFHYQNEAMYMRKNSDFGDEFHYNASGIEVHTPIANLPYYVISDVRKGSPAEEAGVKVGDVIQYLNRRPVESYTLNEVHNRFYNKEGSRIRMTVLRDDTARLEFNFRMKDELQLQMDN
ncbi:retropepsin-like aspartic protease [Gracilimonas mengyeensis]|uniref:Aspartyl protease n=1 Tax=Gracilimonas mengyeensis TaxID=1302730 RepID=A0A521DWV7_9BACT|nr:aspartyl protease family protein [Gracilimonas mengyeensis]SMO75350.1 Aspartyl protease [Gracilimonas mengyeensis]